MNRDELIMRHHDGELTAEESAEFERSLASEPSVRVELARLARIGSVVREVRPLPEIDLTAGIFERLGLPVAEPVPPVSSSFQREQAPARVPVPRLRRIRPGLALAGVTSALAAAAALALWLTPVSKPAPEEEVAQGVSRTRVEEVAEVAAPAPAISVPDPEPPEQSVAVERVDFGSSEGAIFLVPNADERTLVVWTLDELADDDEGEEADL